MFKDVTDGKITNPSFEKDGVIPEKKDQGITLTTGWKIQAISFGRVAIFNSSSTATSPYNSYGPSDPSAGDYYLMIRSNEAMENTDKTQSVRQESAMSLTKNRYRVSFDYKVAQCTGNTLTLTVSALAGSSSLAKTEIDIPQIEKNTSYFNSIEWTKGSFDLSLTETKDIKIDITCITRSKKDGSKTTFALLDNFKLEWNLTQSLKDLISEANTFLTEEDDAEGTSYTALKSAIDAANDVTGSDNASTLETQYNALTAALDLAKNHRKPWLAAKAAAEAAIANDDYENVTGNEKTALETEIAKAEPSDADGYDSAKSALETATSTFTAAKTNYDAFVAAKTAETPDLDYATEAKKTAVTTAKGVSAATSASDADTKTAAIATALRAYYESHAAAEDVATASDLTSRITDAEDPSNTNAWTKTNTTGNINLRIQSGQPYTDADGTNSHKYYDSNSWSSAFTSTISQNLTLPAGTYLLTVKARGNEVTTYKVIANYEETTNEISIPSTGNTGGVYGNGWNDYSVEFTLTGSKTVTIGIYVESGSSSKWVSFGDFRLVKLDATYAETADYEALADAISTIEGSLGFDAGEYAPYNVASALATAKAFDSEEDNIQSEVQDATAALLALTTNASEVNAVYNGCFAEALTGWTRSNAYGEPKENITGDYSTAYYNQPGSLKYGDTGLYTMPLKGATYYTLNMAYRKHDNATNVTASVLNGSDGLEAKSLASPTSTTDWTEQTVTFKTGTAGNYVITLANTGNIWFTGISLLRATTEELKTLLLAEINTANTAYNSGANVGAGIFQIPTDAGGTFSSAIETAQGVYDDGDATVDEVATAIEDLKAAEETFAAVELNAPDAGKRYYLKVATADHAKEGNAVVMALGSTSVNNPTGYTYKASATPASYLAQAFTFTQVSGNTYKIQMGSVYLTNGTNNGSAAGWKASQIQGTTDASKAMTFTIEAADVANTFYIYNSETNSTIACQDEGNLYTEAGNAYFTLEEASQASVPVTIAADVKLATRIFPFKPTLPEGVKAYSCNAVDDIDSEYLKLEEVADPEANVPYILYAEDGYSGDALTGWGTAIKDCYDAGWLTGVYTSTTAPVGSYVLQNLPEQDGVAFYLVQEDHEPTIGANRCYLTGVDGARALYFDFDETTAVETIQALTAGKNTIYNVAGKVVPSLQKGLNIIKTSDGKIRKVIVK